MIEGSPIQPESENTTKNIVVVDTGQLQLLVPLKWNKMGAKIDCGRTRY